MVELGIAESDRGLVGKDGGDFPLHRRDELGLRGLEQQDPQHTRLVLEGQVQAALNIVRLEIRAEHRHEHPFGVRSRVAPIRQIERLAVAGCPLRPGDQILELGVFGIDLLLTRDRPDLTATLVEYPHGAAVERERPGGEIDHGVEHPVQVERCGDFPADLQQQREVACPLLDGMKLGVAQGSGGTRCQPLQQLAVALVEDSGAGQLVGDLDGPHGNPGGNHGSGHDRRRQHLGRIDTGLVAGIVDCAGNDRGSGPLGHISDEAGSDRHLRAHQLPAGATFGQPAPQHVALGNPERPALGSQAPSAPAGTPGAGARRNRATR